MVAEQAAKLRADLVVIAGDFFDRNRVRDNVVQFAVEVLESMPCPALVLPGNHDCLVPNSVYNRPAWRDSDKLRVFREPEGETIHMPGSGISAWGRPLMSYGDDVHPLKGMPVATMNGHWEIAVAHGYLAEAGGRSWASFHLTRDEICESGRHYVALGDSHAYRCIAEESVTAYYSGSPSSGTHTLAVVDFDDDGGVRVVEHSTRELLQL